MTSSSLELSSQLLVGELLKRASHQLPDGEAFIYEDKRKTFQQMDDTVTHLAGWLQKSGVEKEEKVGFMMKNSLPFVEITMGIALSGAVGVPINFRFGSTEVDYIVNQSDVKLLFIDAEYLDMIQSIKNSLTHVEKIIVVDAAGELPQGTLNYNSIYEKDVTYIPCETLTDDDPCFIMYTSGTTGFPKGAVLTHKNMCQNVINHIYESNIRRFSSQLICAPQFHIAGMLLTLKTFLLQGKTVLHRDFDPVNVLTTLEKEKINTVFLVPAMWNFLFQVPHIGDFDLSSVKVCATGAAITPLEVKKRILHYFNHAMLADNFGQAETTATTTCLTGEDALKKPESVGKPYLNIEIRVVDEQMNDVPRGEVGEIVYRGPTVMKEYYNDPDATKEAFKGGWFHSGDLVKMDDEGFIYVVDRKKNMIISGGENIYPAEIEEVLYQMPEILECAVIGIIDETWGEAVKAIVVLKPDHHLSEQQIVDYCDTKLASFKKPKVVEFIDELPRNTSGKVLKYALEKRSISKVSERTLER